MDMNFEGSPESEKLRFPDHPAHYTTTPRQQREKQIRRLKKALAIETAMIAVILLLILLSMAGSAVSGLVGASGRMRKTIVRSGDASSRIAVIPLAGVMYPDGPRGGTTGWILEALEEAENDPLVRAVVLEIESPGGAISSADIIHHRLKKLRESGKTVVAFLGGVAASGGYYVAAPADEIVAMRSTITGSIGVIMQTYRVDELMRKVGVEALTVKTGRMKDIGSPFREITDEERALLQALADEAHGQFVSVIAEGRNMSPERVARIADGRVLSASQAMEAGLVDKIGYLEDAIESAESRAGVPGATVVRYGKMPTLVEVLYGRSGAPDPAAELARILSGMGPAYLAEDVPSALYLWSAGAASSGQLR
jgi:protease-4